jgi:deazaflavin-dependent oxidoreductase (nitroreductase family)
MSRVRNAYRGHVPAARSQDLPQWLRAAFGAPNRVYEAGFGWVLGHRFLRLTHTGRRSGRQHHVVVEVVRYDRRTGEATVVSGFGPLADWYRNVTAGGPALVDFGRGPRPARHRVLSPTEAEQVYAAYERRNVLISPLVRWTLTALLGWRYDGSVAARRRMVGELPMLAFRPTANRVPDADRLSPAGPPRRR